MPERPPSYQQQQQEVITSNNNNVVSSNLNDYYGTGPIGAFLRRGGEIPLVVMTCNRVDLLKETLKNIQQVNSMTKDIVVIQDGVNNDIKHVVDSYGYELIQNKQASGQLRGYDGASRIATHYKFALSTIFDIRQDAPAVIIIEDDLLLSPDFYEYFIMNSIVLDQDKSLMMVSSWNDNGFKDHVYDAYELRRTEFFPGLGWLLTRELYKNELEKKWPRSHWDHWLRSQEVNKGREIVYPQVPRTYHNGVKGTFMNLDTHNQYFKDIDYNQDKSINWLTKVTTTSPPYKTVISSNYEERIVHLIKNDCHHVQHVDDLVNHHHSKVLCLWINEENDSRFRVFAKVFGLWHEHKRGVHKGLHEFYWKPKGVKNNDKGSYVLLLNVYTREQSYQKYKPPKVPIITAEQFRSLVPHLRGS